MALRFWEREEETDILKTQWIVERKQLSSPIVFAIAVVSLGSLLTSFAAIE